jgi:hypothetical protein
MHTKKASAPQREQLGIISHNHSQDQGKRPGRWTELFRNLEREKLFKSWVLK